MPSKAYPETGKGKPEPDGSGFPREPREKHLARPHSGGYVRDRRLAPFPLGKLPAAATPREAYFFL
ncbi:MAG: hypothetical protein JWP58_2454 [Hymenobacter sp.]|nr:hypothetical protein [Hymenobacter sp.]